MRITVLSNLYPPLALGGYEILCSNVVSQLKKLGHEVDVLTSTHGESAGENDGQVSRALHLYAPFSRPAGMERRNRRKAYRSNYHIAQDHFKDKQPDIVFVWSQLRLTTAAAKAAQDMGIPTAFTFNDPHIHSYLPCTSFKTLRKMVSTLLDATINRKITIRDLDLSHTTCISANLKNDLLKKGVPISNTEIIYQGIPLDQFPFKENSTSETQQTIHLLYTGQLHEYKGVHLGIDAVKKLADNGPVTYTLNLIGTGPASYTDRLHRQVDKDQTSALITFSGTIEREKLSAHLQAADILLFTSIWDEPFGLSHLESMASGTVVISTFRGGMKEFLVHEDNCLTFDPEHPESLVAAIRRLTTDSSLREQLITNARTMVEKKFSIERYTSDLLVFLKKACSTRDTP